MSSRAIFATVAAELSLFLVAAATSGCATGTAGAGFADESSGSSPHTTAATALGTYAASAGVTQQYGITQWRTYFGTNQMVITGYRADGSAARGVQFAWFSPAQGSVGHTRLTMLDGSGSVLRRLVGGGESGHLSNAQIGFIQTMRSDIAIAAPTVHKRIGAGAAPGRHLGVGHSLEDGSGMSLGNGPNQGPQCFDASNDPATVLDGSGCILGAATFETVMGGLMAMGTCTQWYLDNENATMVCDNENSSSCNSDNPPTCNWGGQDAGTGTTTDPMPQPQCDEACICANYGTYNGMPCSQTCTDNATCGSGQECHWGSCGPAATPADSPTNQNVSQSNAGTTSCASGNVTTDPSTGQVGCSSSSGDASGNGSGGSSGGSSSGGSSSGTDTTGTDPATGSSGGGSSSGGAGGSSSGGGQCADDGAGCSQDSDCCLGACSSGTCGVSNDGSSSGGSSGGGSSSGGSCAADGAGCGQDSDCCGGSCDTSSGTCGAASGSSSGGSSSGSSSGGSCAADGSSCAQDSDCCGGSCDTSSGTCGAASGSSSGGSSSGSSSGGSCAPDGSGCAQDSDCCGGTCSSGTCGAAAPTCGNPGDGCAQDSDCCSGSCDTSAGACN